MKTAYKVMVATWFRPSKVFALLQSAKRISVKGNARRYGFADGSVIETVDGKCRVVTK